MEGFIKWRDELLLGIETLDNQHRVLADCLNRLVQACSCDGQPDAADKARKMKVLEGLTEELYSITKEHFMAEEAMMRNESYPGYASHAREHVMLLAELKSTFARKLREGCCDMNPEVLRSLKSWFVIHVARSDREFADFLLGRAADRVGTGGMADAGSASLPDY